MCQRPYEVRFQTILKHSNSKASSAESSAGRFEHRRLSIIAQGCSVPDNSVREPSLHAVDLLMTAYMKSDNGCNSCWRRKHMPAYIDQIAEIAFPGFAWMRNLLFPRHTGQEWLQCNSDTPHRTGPASIRNPGVASSNQI